MANNISTINTVVGTFTVNDDGANGVISVTGPSTAVFIYSTGSTANAQLHQTTLEGAFNFCYNWTSTSVSLNTANTLANTALATVSIANTLAALESTSVSILSELTAIEATLSALEGDVHVLSSRGSNFAQGIVTTRADWTDWAPNNITLLVMGLENNNLANSYIWYNEQVLNNVPLPQIIRFNANTSVV